MKFRSILVPLDGSAFAEQALPHALGLAHRARARLELVYVHEPVTIPDLALPSLEKEDRELRERAATYLDGLVEQVAARVPGGVTRSLVIGSPVDGLCESAAAADLVVMTTHGRGPLTRIWFGSVATELLQRSPAPILLVRPKEEPPDMAADPAPGRILIPLDGSPFAEQVIPLAVAVGHLTGAEYRLLRVTSPVQTGAWDRCGRPPAHTPTMVEQLKVEAQRYLTTLAAQANGLGTAAIHVAVDWPPAVAILGDAEANSIDLIAMGTRGRSGLARFFLGSVADKVVRGATVPVLLCRPPAE